jgi:hypothetical protein
MKKQVGFLKRIRIPTMKRRMSDHEIHPSLFRRINRVRAIGGQPAYNDFDDLIHKRSLSIKI